MIPRSRYTHLRPLWFALGVLAMLVVVGGAYAPSDIYGHDQPKTIAYTVDMVKNGRWALPGDTLGGGATKPPMYNWLAVPTVGWLGHYESWSHRFPAVVSSLATLMLCIGSVWWLLARERGRPMRRDNWSDRPTPDPMAVALTAGLIWISAYPVAKMFNLARPDPVLTAFLVGGWLAATRIVTAQHQQRVVGAAAAFWVCVAGAALTKGPVALLPIIYLIAAAPLIGRRWGTLARCGWWWGLPLVALLVGGWAWAAYQQDPGHFKAVFGPEVAKRFTEGETDGPPAVVGILLNTWQMPAYFLSRFVPWCLPAAMALAHLARRRRPQRTRWAALRRKADRSAGGLRFAWAALWRRWFGHRLGPAVLWSIVVMAFFSGALFKRADYIVPMYPAAAGLAAYWLVVIGAGLRITPNRVALVCFVVALGVIVQQNTSSHAARTQYGVHVEAFADDIRRIAGADPVAFVDSGYNGLQSLVGAHQPKGTPLPLEQFRWLVHPLDDSHPAGLAWATSKTVPDKRNTEKQLGLFRLEGGAVAAPDGFRRP